MAWRIDFTRNADKAMRKLDKGVAARVFDELDEIAKLEDPRSRGKALTGNLAGVWRYRVGDYRILCDINDGRLVILVVDVAHRREVYKREVKSVRKELGALAAEAQQMRKSGKQLESERASGRPESRSKGVDR